MRTAVFLVLVCAVFFLLGRVFSDSPNPHTDRVFCSECHLRDPARVTAGEASTNLFVTDIEAICLRCHRDIRLSMTHPTAVKPSFSLPSDMYLDWKGELTCTTCHYMHHDGDTPYGRGNDKHLRRSSTGRAFCMECHDRDDLTLRALVHSLAEAKAHRRFDERDPGGSLDDSSVQCLTCHDGSISGDAGTTSLGSGLWRHDTDVGRNSHPIGVDYSEAYRDAPREYVEMGAIPPEIVLPGGKVECVSCHNLYAQNEYLLSVTNQGSRLCLTCHRK